MCASQMVRADSALYNNNTIHPSPAVHAFIMQEISSVQFCVSLLWYSRDILLKQEINLCVEQWCSPLCQCFSTRPIIRNVSPQLLANNVTHFWRDGASKSQPFFLNCNVWKEQKGRKAMLADDQYYLFQPGHYTIIMKEVIARKLPNTLPFAVVFFTHRTF